MESRGPNGNRFSTVPADPGGRLKRSSSEASTAASDTASNHKSRESAKILPSIPFPVLTKHAELLSLPSQGQVCNLQDTWEVNACSPALLIGWSKESHESLAFRSVEPPPWNSRRVIYEKINGRPAPTRVGALVVAKASSIEAYEACTELGPQMVIRRSGVVICRLDILGRPSALWDLIRDLGVKVLQFDDLYTDLNVVLGRGSFSKCSLHQCRATKSYKALKSTRYGTVDRKAAAPFTEVEVLRHIVHPYLVRFYDSFLVGNQIVVVMENLEGDMWKYAEKRKGVEPAALSEVMRRMLAAICCIHKWGAVHRDVKPENVMLRAANDPRTAVLIDLGLCLLSDDGHGRHRCGSPGYCAPEIINSRPYDCKVDVYSLGITCWALATGKSPFKRSNIGDTLRANQKNELSYDYPVFKQNPTLQDFIVNLSQKDPWRRYSTEDAMKHPFVVHPPRSSK